MYAGMFDFFICGYVTMKRVAIMLYIFILRSDMHGPSMLCWNRYLNILYKIYWKDRYLSKFHFRSKIVSGIRHTNNVLFFFHKMFEQTSFIHHCKKVSSQEDFLFCIISIYINKMYYSSYYLIGIQVLKKKHPSV